MVYTRTRFKKYSSRKKVELAFTEAAKLAHEYDGSTLFECPYGDGSYVAYRAVVVAYRAVVVELDE